ncbi:MAG: M24 family metallopeptidase [Planctomycetia bacterium]|nr:M24 family metallopeptidase [Planctomycetia bacterium]
MRHAPIDPAMFRAHRDALRNLLPPRSLAIIHAADVPATNGDGTLRMVPAADLFHLTGIEQEESVLLLAPDAADPGSREVLFIRQPNETSATWEGRKLSKDEAHAASGVARVRWIADLHSVLHGLMCESERVFLNANEHERARIDVEPRDARLARELIARYPLHRYERLAPLMRRLRAVKSPTEVALLRTAIDITDAGLRRVLGTLRPGVHEYEIEAELIGEFTRRRARFAYEPIVASGPNACVLHYNDNDAECREGDLVLIDVGASYANYASDLTRTYPVGGRFTPRQRAVYDAVLRVMRAATGRLRPGLTPRDWKRAAQLDMNEELLKLGLLTKDDLSKDSAEEPACKKYFMHGLGHSLGLGVHDLAPVNGPFEPGWVLTVEPGIYIPQEGLGIRLENDLLVTADGCIDLCAHVPVEADEVEALLAR